MNPLKILFIVNPNSGRGGDGDPEKVVRDFFSSLPHAVHFFYLDGKVADEEIKKTIRDFSPDAVVAVGGDGTVTAVAKQLLGTSISLGILPAGSANGMARELNIPTDFSKALQIVIGQNIKQADVIRINDKEICLHLSDIGMNAQLIRYFKDSSLRGKIGYARLIFKVLLHRRRMKVMIESKEEELLRSAVMVAIANASKYGTGATINPNGSLYDGWFEVVVVRRLGFIEILKMFIKVKRFDPKKIEVISARSVTIETSSKMHFQIDGEYMGRVDSVKAKILPAKLNLIVPTDEKAQ